MLVAHFCATWAESVVEVERPVVHGGPVHPFPVGFLALPGRTTVANMLACHCQRGLRAGFQIVIGIYNLRILNCTTWVYDLLLVKQVRSGPT